jgi:hypothetical protein
MLHNATLFLAVVVERNARRCALVSPPPPSGETVKRLSQRDLWRLTVSSVRWYTEQMFGFFSASADAQPLSSRGEQRLEKRQHRNAVCRSVTPSTGTRAGRRHRRRSEGRGRLARRAQHKRKEGTRAAAKPSLVLTLFPSFRLCYWGRGGVPRPW